MDRIYYEECRKHCSCCANPLKALAIAYAFDEEFSGYERKALQDSYHQIPEKIRKSKKLHEEELPFILSCVISWSNLLMTDVYFPNRLQALINKIYFSDGYHDNWEFCLDHKSEGTRRLHDYLYGCNSSCKNDPDAMKHRHAHQFCIATASLQKAEKLLTEKLGEWLNECTTFEDLYCRFRGEDREIIRGLGSLSIYDSSLRIAWKENRDLMPTKIYFHAGVKWGGEALYHISRLVKINWYVGESNPKKISPDTPVETNLFNGFLLELTEIKERTHHVENLLCCFHEPFFLTETVLRVKKGEPLRIDPVKIIVNAKKALERAKEEAKSKGKALKKTSYESYIRPQDRRYLKLLELLGYKN